LGCIQTDDHHPQEDLANFGYRLYTKVFKKKESFYILATCLLEPVVEIS
jgi:hypothetical protein